MTSSIRTWITGIALTTFFVANGYSEDKANPPAPWMDRAEAAINGAFIDGKSLNIFGSNLIGILHPSGTAGFLEDIKIEKSPDGNLGVEFDLSWKGGLVGTDYKTVVFWIVNESGHVSSSISSDNAPTAVSKDALAKMDEYFRETFINVLGDAQPKKKRKVLNLKVKAALSALSSIRSAMQSYYGDHEGSFPADLKDLAPQYLKQLPVISIKPGLQTNAVANPKLAALDSCRSVLGTGGWLYFNNSKNTATWGNVVIDSAELSPEGKRWCEY